jgi:hypothetical protein
MKKIYQPWPSRTLGATAGCGMNSHPTPGSLFAMDWSRLLSKGIVRFFKSAKKKNYLLMAFILFYFLLCPSLIASKTITLHPPCDACRPPVLLRPSPVAPVCFWLVVECNCVVLHPFKAAAFFFSYICQSIQRSVQGDNTPPHAPPWPRLLSKAPPIIGANS